MKYIIKNCPCYDNRIWQEPTCNTNALDCQNISDCLLKQIANKCKYEKDKGFVMSRNGCRVPASEGYDLASEILEQLEIDEVERVM